MGNKMFKLGAITGSLSKINDRYCMEGYKDELPLIKRLQGLSKIDKLEGIEISQGEIEGMSAEELDGLVKKYNLKISTIGIDLSSNREWRFGTITNENEGIRRQAVEKIKETMDFAAELEVDLINIWLGQDGFDYPFQVNYSEQWNYAVKCIQECADYNPLVKLALEPKPCEPRNRSFIDSTSTGLLLVADINRKNVGVTIDIGHVLQDGKNMTQAITYAAEHGKLFNIHVNDNYCGWDNDMIIGSVHTIEFIELFYALKKMNYDKWCTIDIFPYREDSILSVEECISYMEKFVDLADLLDEAQIDKYLKADKTTAMIRLIREAIFK